MRTNILQAVRGMMNDPLHLKILYGAPEQYELLYYGDQHDTRAFMDAKEVWREWWQHRYGSAIPGLFEVLHTIFTAIPLADADYYLDTRTGQARTPQGYAYITDRQARVMGGLAVGLLHLYRVGRERGIPAELYAKYETGGGGATVLHG